MKALYVVLFATFCSSVYTKFIYPYYNPEGRHINGYQFWVSWKEVDEHISSIVSRDRFKLTDDVLRKSLETVKNFFADPKTKVALTAITIGTSKVPIFGEFFSIVSSVAGLLEDESDWKDKFSSVIAEEIKKGHVMNDLDNFNDVVHSMKNHFALLNESVTGETKITWKTAPEIIGFTTDIFSRLEEMIISFAKPDSHYKRHPLIGAPFFIELSLLVLSFEPIAIALLKEASRHKLSCQMRDATKDFLPFVLSGRFEKTNLTPEISTRTRNFWYKKDGYMEDWEMKQPLPCGTASYDCATTNGMQKFCLIDELSTKNYVTWTPNDGCEMTYATYLRTLVEKRFPIELLEQECDQLIGNSTGFGWITIKTKNKWEGTRYYVRIYANQSTQISTDESEDYTSVYGVKIWKASTTLTFSAYVKKGWSGYESELTKKVHEFYHGDYATYNFMSGEKEIGSTTIDVIWQDEREEVTPKTPVDLKWGTADHDDYVDCNDSANKEKCNQL